MRNLKKVFSLSILTSSILLGATIPNSSTIQRDIEPPKDLPKKSIPLVEIGGVQKYKEPMKDDKSGKTIFVKEFKLTGVKNISLDKLKELIKEYENKDLTFNQLQEVASIITKEYRLQGYFVARAYIPAQDIKENILEISIIEGNYGEFNLNNNSSVKDNVVQDILNRVKKDTIISSNAIEKTMLLINDTPGVKVTKAQIKPGKDVGTSDFDIQTESTKKYNGYVVVDNHGSRYTGKNRINANVSINTPFEIGDKISIGGLTSSEFDLKSGSLVYELPVLPNGLKASFGYSYTKYDLIEEYKSLDASGESKIFNATLSYPLIRSKNENLYTRVTYYNKSMQDDTAGTITSDKEINSLEAAMNYIKNYELFNLPASLNTTASLTTGDLSTIDVNAYDGSYNKINLSISNELALNNTLSLATTLNTQKVLGGKNLDGSEDLSVGGIGAVRAYSSSEQSAENGYVANIELYAQLPKINQYSHKVSVFYDFGNVYMEDVSKDSSFERKTLQDIGVGYYSNYKDFFLKSNLAYTINHEVTAEPVYHSKFLVQAGWVF